MKNRFNNLSNHKFILRCLIAATLISILAGGCGRNQICSAEPEAYNYAVVADPQLFWGAREHWKTTIESVNALKPDFLVVCGDMTNDAADAAQTKAYFDELSKLDKEIPVYHVPGNHDITLTKPATIEWYEKYFGKQWYSFEHKGSLFIVINSNLLKEPHKAQQLADEQMIWLKETLAQAQSKQYKTKILFMHHPLCLKEMNEETQYFNIPTETRNKFVELMNENNIIAVFSGHYHKNAYVADDQIEIITTSSSGIALGQGGALDPLGYRIVTVDGCAISHKYVSIEKAASEVECCSKQ